MSGLGGVFRCAGRRKLWPSLFVALQDGTPLRANAARMCVGGLSDIATKAVAVLKEKGIEFTLSNVGEAHVSCHLRERERARASARREREAERNRARGASRDLTEIKSVLCLSVHCI